MPKTTVNTPDGPVDVNHPDGATQEQILRFAKREFDLKIEQREQRLSDLRLSNPGEFDPQSREFKARFGPTGNFGQNLAAGTGKAIFDIGRGAAQLGVEGANLIPGIDLDETAASLRSNITDVRERDEALLGTGGGLTGFIGTNIGAALLPGGLASGTGRLANTARAFSNPQSFRAAAGTGSVLGALNPVAETESRTLNVGLGAGAGVLGKAIAQPIVNQLNRGGSAARELLESEGVPLNLAQRTGSNRAQTISGILDDSVLTGNAQARFKDTQLRAFTRAVLRKIGADSDEATESVMSKANRDIGRIFDDAAEGVDIRMSDGLGQDLLDIFDEAQLNLTQDAMNLFQKNWQRVFDNVRNGVIPGNVFKQLRSQFSKASKNPNFGQQAGDVERALMESLKRAAPAKAALLDDAIAKWRNLKIIQGAVGKGESRFISPLRLSSTLTTKQNQNLSVFGRGRDENIALAKLARAGRELLPDFANSGTGRRTQVPLVAGLGAGAAAGSIFGPAGAGVGAVLGLGGPGIVQRAITSQGLLGEIIEQGLPGLLQPAVKQGAIAGSQLIQ